jgi:HD-GYP domain-containing protein (c-di-GMP phosphodiesterase class II)
MEQELVNLDGRPYVHLVYHMGQLPTGEHLYIEGMFAISEDARFAMRTDLLESILWEVGIIMLTALLLYPVILKLTKRLSDFSEDLLEAQMDMLQTLGSAIAKRDSDTSAHNFRVTLIAVRIAESMKLSHHDMQCMIKGAFLHDVGKIGISDTILLKPGKLTDEEFDIMKTHVNHGVDILTQNEGLTGTRDAATQRETSRWIDDARDVVAGHHEKFNGTGYPNGVKGQDIPRVARIFAIADVFDALTCRRPYKEPFSYEKSMAIIDESRGSHFDPDVVDAFVPLSEAIYNEISGREDEGLRDELKDITSQYFKAGLQSLKV